MKIIFECIYCALFSLLLKHRKWIISRSDKKIKRLTDDLIVENKYNKMLLEDTLRLCEKFQKEMSN